MMLLIISLIFFDFLATPTSICALSARLRMLAACGKDATARVACWLGGGFLTETVAICLNPCWQVEAHGVL